MAKGYPDFSFTGAGLYLMPEWAAKEATDKNFSGSAGATAGTEKQLVNYTVPSGKTLYISHFGASLKTEAANMYGYLYNLTTGVYLAFHGGAQGFFAALNKPIAVPGGEQVAIYGAQFGSALRIMSGHFSGYEI